MHLTFETGRDANTTTQKGQAVGTYPYVILRIAHIQCVVVSYFLLPHTMKSVEYTLYGGPPSPSTTAAMRP